MFIASYSRFDRKVLFKPEIISTILRRKADTDESTARPACMSDYRLLERQNLNSHCTTACYTRYIQGRIFLIPCYTLFVFQFKQKMQSCSMNLAKIDLLKHLKQNDLIFMKRLCYCIDITFRLFGTNLYQLYKLMTILNFVTVIFMSQYI